MSRLVKHPDSCDNCSGKGRAVVDHVAWLSGGEVREKDIYGSCPECNGTGLIQEVEDDYSNGVN